MTREEKIEKRKTRASTRRKKRIEELGSITRNMVFYDYTFREARRFVRSGYRPFQCEMRYGDCETRGYCNGDC